MGKVLVCGGAGYIGSHINKMLNQQGYETVIFDNLVYGHEKAVKWGELVVGDLNDPQALDDLFNKYSFDAVMHFAAYAYVGESVADPEKYWINNVSNTLNLLKAMREYGVNKIVFSSTCSIFGNTEISPITENVPQNPINPYAKTKLTVENIFRDYNRAYDLQFVILRYFNAAGADPDGEIGESHNPETHLIPLVLDAASGVREDIKVFGTDYDTPDGSCIRDYIHVIDLASAHLLALHYLEDGKPSDFFNLGTENGTSVLEVIESVRRVTGKEVKTILADRRPGDPARLIGGINKAKEVLGWKPVYDDIDTIVGHAWKWHENKEY